MIIRTSFIIQKSPDSLWKLLCQSKLQPREGWPFALGLPRPIECRLPDGIGGVGARRQCISNRGLINQRITTWDAPDRLRFAMEDTTLSFIPQITAISEMFELKALRDGRTAITRTTLVELSGTLRWLKGLIVWPALKCIHCYVFKDWNQ